MQEVYESDGEVRPITQEDLLGCGIACVAFILKKPYQQTKKKYFKNYQGNVGLYCRDIIEVLKKAGLQYNYKYLKRKVKIKENYLIFIRRSKEYPAGHYLVKSSSGWMDPWINYNDDNNVLKAKSGFRQRLPGKAIYVVYPE